MQPPVPHQYGVWLFSTQASSSIFPSLCVSPSLCQLPPTSVSAVCFFGSHGIFSILRMSLFHLPHIPVIGLPGRGTQFGSCRVLVERDKSRPLSFRFLQTRSLRGDDSWRNALLIPPNTGHMRVVWVASRQGEENNVCVIAYDTFITCRQQWRVFAGTCDRYSTMEPRLCAGVWPSSEARRDSQQQLAQVVTHFLSVPEAQTGLLVLQQWEEAAGLSTASGERLRRTD